MRTRGVDTLAGVPGLGSQRGRQCYFGRGPGGRVGAVGRGLFCNNGLSLRGLASLSLSQFFVQLRDHGYRDGNCCLRRNSLTVNICIDLETRTPRCGGRVRDQAQPKQAVRSPNIRQAVELLADDSRRVRSYRLDCCRVLDSAGQLFGAQHGARHYLDYEPTAVRSR